MNNENWAPKSSFGQRFAKFLFKLHGWRLTGKPIPKEVGRCVFVFAPHTSNWDFYYGIMCMIGWGIPFKVAIKKFWLKFPFSLVVKPLGGVGIDRSPDKTKKNQVRNMAAAFKENQWIAFIITPEGSRGPRDKWKTGFYYIAQEADVPIVTLTGSYSDKTIEFGPVFSAKEDLDSIMKQMIPFFSKSDPKHPPNFKLDSRYL